MLSAMHAFCRTNGDKRTWVLTHYKTKQTARARGATANREKDGRGSGECGLAFVRVLWRTAGSGIELSGIELT
jgi:hypothetical protein